MPIEVQQLFIYCKTLVFVVMWPSRKIQLGNYIILVDPSLPGEKCKHQSARGKEPHEPPQMRGLMRLFASCWPCWYQCSLHWRDYSVLNLSFFQRHNRASVGSGWVNRTNVFRLYLNRTNVFRLYLRQQSTQLKALGSECTPKACMIFFFYMDILLYISCIHT